MVEDLLKLRCRLFTPMRRQISFPTHINGIQIRPVVKTQGREPKFVGNCDVKGMKRVWRTGAKKRELATQSGQIIELCNCIFRELLIQTLGDSLRSFGVSRIRESECDSEAQVSPERPCPKVRGLLARSGDVTEQ